MSRNPTIVVAFVVLTVLLVGVVPTANAQAGSTTSGDLNGTITTPFATTGTGGMTSGSVVDVNQETGKILVSYVQSGGGCRIAILDPDGAQLLDKEIGVGSGVVCEATWFDTDSIIVPLGPSFLRSDNSGIGFTTITPGGACGGTAGVPAGHFVKVTDTYWGYMCGAGTFAWTNNAGASWTTVSHSGTTVGTKRMAYRGTPGEWVIFDTATPNPRVFCSSDNFATLTGGTTQAWTTGQGNGGTEQSQSVRDFQYYGGAAWVPGVFPGTQSLFSTSADTGFALTTDCGVSWTYASGFVFDSGGQGSALNSLTLADDGFLYYGFRQTGTVRHILGRYDGTTWEWKIVEDLAASTTRILSSLDTYSDSTLFGHIGGATDNQLLTAPGFDAPSEFVDITVSGLTQADMDPKGTIIIARTDVGDTIETFNTAGTSLGTLTGVGCTDFPDVYGGVSVVFVKNEAGANYYTSFGQCTEATDTVNVLSVRNEGLGSPAYPSDCTSELCEEDNEQFCDEIPNPGCSGDDPFDFDIPSDIRHLGTLEAFPYTFEQFTAAGTDFGPATWTFSTTSGEIGAVSVGYNNFGGDTGDRVLVDVFPPDTITGFCSWYDKTTDGDYIAGVADDGNSPTSFARVFASQESISDAPGVERIDLAVEVLFSVGNALAGAQGLSCTNDRAFMVVDNDIFLIDLFDGGPTNSTTNATVIWTVQDAVTAPQFDSATMSADGKFVAWAVSNTQAAYASTTNGTVLGTIPIPASAFRGIDLSATGGTLAIYTANTIRVADISSDTCQLNCSFIGDTFSRDTTEPPTAEDEPGFTGGIIQGLSGTAKVILSIILILFMGVIGWGLSSGRRRGRGEQ